MIRAITKSRLKAMAATTLFVVGGIVAGIDVAGTPLAITAIKHAEGAGAKGERASVKAERAALKAERASRQVEAFARASTAANIRARESDCRQQNQVRWFAIERVIKNEHEAKVNLRLLHIPETPALDKKLKEGYADEKKQVKLVNCTTYGHLAAP